LGGRYDFEFQQAFPSGKVTGKTLRETKKRRF